MPLTTLDSNAALIVIDLQKGITAIPTVHPMPEIVGRSAELARAFRARGLPVVLVNVTGMAPGRTDAGRPNFAFPPDWAELVPELEQQPTDQLPPQLLHRQSRLLSKRELSDMSSSIRELSKKLAHIKLKLKVQSVFVIGKAHDACVVERTRELTEWLLEHEPHHRV